MIQLIETSGGNQYGDSAKVGADKINANFTELYASKLDSVIVVKSAADFGTIDSTKLYYIDGIVDMGSTPITVPANGISIRGGTFDVSKLISSAANYTMFVSDGGGSGDILMIDLAIEVTGTNSQVYNLTDATGFNAFEFNRVNYNNCTSLGIITNYRQGFESGTGRFGGKPQLTLAGTWVGGYYIDTSIVRGLINGAYSLYKAGSGFLMASRFRSNQNIDLPSSANFFDFSASHFPNPSTLQIDGAIITRNGASNAEDTNITPNILASALPSNWYNNSGMPNTYVGGRLRISASSATTVSVINTYYDIAGTYAASDLQHFDNPSNGQLRHLGNNPRDYNFVCDLVFTGTANDLLSVKVVKWDNSASSFVDVYSQVRRVNSLAGANDSAFFTMIVATTLDRNDYVKMQVSNTTAARNVTMGVDSFYTLQER